jgi:hypothetical protein
VSEEEEGKSELFRFFAHWRITTSLWGNVYSGKVLRSLQSLRQLSQVVKKWREQHAATMNNAESTGKKWNNYSARIKTLDTCTLVASLYYFISLSLSLFSASHLVFQALERVSEWVSERERLDGTATRKKNFISLCYFILLRHVMILYYFYFYSIYSFCHHYGFKYKFLYWNHCLTTTSTWSFISFAFKFLGSISVILFDLFYPLEREASERDIIPRLCVIYVRYFNFNWWFNFLHFRVKWYHVVLSKSLIIIN